MDKAKLLEKFAQKSKELVDAMSKDKCGLVSPSRQWECILPKGHAAEHKMVVLATWEGNKEVLLPYK